MQVSASPHSYTHRSSFRVEWSVQDIESVGAIFEDAGIERASASPSRNFAVKPMISLKFGIAVVSR